MILFRYWIASLLSLVFCRSYYGTGEYLCDVCVCTSKCHPYDFRPIYNGYMKVCFTLHIGRLIALNTSRSNLCITVCDDATFSSQLSAHLSQIFIFSFVGGTWRLACTCEAPLKFPPSYHVLMGMGTAGYLASPGISRLHFCTAVLFLTSFSSALALPASSRRFRGSPMEPWWLGSLVS